MAGSPPPVDGTLYSQPAKAGDFVKLGTCWRKMADLHKVRVRVFIDEPELGALEPKSACEDYLGCAAQPELGGEDGNYSEAGGGARIAERGRTALLGEQR